LIVHRDIAGAVGRHDEVGFHAAAVRGRPPDLVRAGVDPAGGVVAYNATRDGEMMRTIGRLMNRYDGGSR
jgi:hypothetical protein